MSNRSGYNILYIILPYDYFLELEIHGNTFKSLNSSRPRGCRRLKTICDSTSVLLYEETATTLRIAINLNPLWSFMHKKNYDNNYRDDNSCRIVVADTFLVDW